MNTDSTIQQYQPGEHPDLPPPANTTGVIGWIRANFFSNWYNTIATVTILYILYLLIPGLLNWVFFDAMFAVSSQRECYDLGKTGACWGFMIKRWGFFIYGFYPQDQRWRIDVAFILLILSILPWLFDTIPLRKYLKYLSYIYLYLGYELVKGAFIFDVIDTSKFGGIMLNVMIGVVGISISLPIGILLALGRRSDLIFIKVICVAFIEFSRGVPLITLLFIASNMLNYFLPPGTSFDLLLRVMIMVTIFAAAYLAEVIRGGLQAIPKGQMEAANAMGLTYWQAMRLIILPQALKISIPGIVNTFIGLFKDTTLVVIISMFDMLGVARSTLQDAGWKGLSREVYVFVAFFFFVFCFAMSRYSIWLEEKLNTGHKR